MTIDTTPLSVLVMETMEAIGDRYSDEYTVRTACIIVECDSEETGQLVVKCTDDRAWVMAALLHEASGSVQALRDEALADNDDDD